MMNRCERPTGAPNGRELDIMSAMNPATPVTLEQQKQWLEQWKNAGVELAAERKKALRRMSHDRALAASDALLALADPSKLSPARRKSSGLVQQQALFHRPLRK